MIDRPIFMLLEHCWECIYR